MRSLEVCIDSRLLSASDIPIERSETTGIEMNFFCALVSIIEEFYH
ncbi:MAG: hypothetical protein AAGG81_06870 [Chlamydiota bacterium]